MMNAHARLVVSSSAFPSSLPPNPKLCSSIRSRCTPRRSSPPVPPLRQLPTTNLQATKTLYPTTTPILTDDVPLDVIGFHHVEFWCADAASAAGRFSFGLGVPLAAKSDLTTGNTVHASHLLRSRSGPLALLITAPYHGTATSSSPVLPSFSSNAARRFAADHGLAVRAIAVRVSDAKKAFHASVAAGARPAFTPAELGHGFVFAEVELYGDIVLRFVSHPDDDTDDVAFLPGFESLPASSSSQCPDYGLNRFDHIVGAVPETDLARVVAYIAGFTGFHEFYRFKEEEVATAESTFNGVVLANGKENVLLSVLEPKHGTKRRSQVQTFLDHHGGPGVQHMAIGSDDLIGTLREIRARSAMGGIELLPPPPPSYYDGVRRLAGDVLSEEQIKECQEFGVRVDKGDHGGVVLQIFTRAPADRPTMLLEFIQRIGCVEIDENGKKYQRGGCGGFQKDNVANLVKDIEDFDKTIDGPAL